MIFTFDIGGTQTRFGLADLEGQIVEFDMFPTKSPSDLMTSIRSFLKKSNVDAIDGISGGIAGIVHDNTLIKSPNLPIWQGFPFKRYFEIEFGELPIIVQNDAQLAGVGEANYGSGRGYSIVAYLTFSTGIGGARIVQGMPDVSLYGFEPGHSLLFSGDAELEFEELVSGTAIKKRYGSLPEELNDPSAWDEILNTIAVGLVNTVFYWSPEAIVIGGGVVKSKYFDFNKLQELMENRIKILPEIPKIIPQSLGDKAALQGAWGLLTKSS